MQKEKAKLDAGSLITRLRKNGGLEVLYRGPWLSGEGHVF